MPLRDYERLPVLSSALLEVITKAHVSHPPAPSHEILHLGIPSTRSVAHVAGQRRIPLVPDRKLAQFPSSFEVPEVRLILWNLMTVLMTSLVSFGASNALSKNNQYKDQPGGLVAHCSQRVDKPVSNAQRSLEVTWLSDFDSEPLVISGSMYDPQTAMKLLTTLKSNLTSVAAAAESLISHLFTQ